MSTTTEARPIKLRAGDRERHLEMVTTVLRAADRGWSNKLTKSLSDIIREFHSDEPRKDWLNLAASGSLTIDAMARLRATHQALSA